MSFCTKHPGKEAVGACCECGHLVCKACYTELNNKVYCESCANKLFTVREKQSPPTVTPPAQVPQKPPTIEKPVPAEPVKQAAQTAQPGKDIITTPPVPGLPDKPAAEAKPAIPKGEAPVEKKVSVTPATAEPKPSQPATAGNKNMGFLWWLAPVFLAFIGGLLAWFMNKNNEPGKAKNMLFAGIGLTVIYAVIITAGVMLSGSSSSGGTIIYVSYTDKSWQIWMMDPDGNNPVKLTTCGDSALYFNVYPSWSPATKKLACYTNRDGNFEVYSIDADGSNQANLTISNFAEYFSDISPDGKKITFMSNRDGNNEIYAMDADGSNIKQLTVSKPVDERPRWSPDGSLIVFNTDRDGNHEIYVMSADGSNQRRLTTNDKWDGQARYSPDGNKIVFVSERDGNPEIYTMDSNGNNQKRVTFNSAKDYAPCFSPDSKRIIYYSNLDGNDEIYIMNPDGGNQVRITNNTYGDQYPLWISEKLKAPAGLKAPSSRARVVGSNVSTANKYYNYSDNITFVKYVAENDGSIDMIKVYSTKAGNVKAAVYDHNAKDDLPMTRVSSNNDPTSCQAKQWNNIYIPPITITKGTPYWLAFNSDTNGVVMLGTGQQKMLKGKAVFEDFSFPDKPPSGMSSSKYNVSISGWSFGQSQSDDDANPSEEDN